MAYLMNTFTYPTNVHSDTSKHCQRTICDGERVGLCSLTSKGCVWLLWKVERMHGSRALGGVVYVDAEEKWIFDPKASKED